jgi:glycosyltransferase involved in cell wall biosynthesis
MPEGATLRTLICIPVYNERKSVEHVLAQVLERHSEVLFVDDGSTDGTAEWLETRSDIRLIRHEKNAGYGQSLIDGFNYADRCGYDWTLTMDCDEQHEPARIPDFLRSIASDRWDIISGSRYLQPSDDDDQAPVDRRSVNTTITALINDTFDWSLTDSFCGYKAHRVSAMRKLQLTETGYAFPLQLWPQVYRAELRVTEIPVRRIYHDLNRSFGAHLDDAGRRLKHYLEVFNDEITKPWPPAVAEDAWAGRAVCCC